jgi:hypothetical protein
VSEITVHATTQAITVSATAGAVSAGVSSSTVSSSAGGGLGPQGPAGTDGGPITQLSDVQIAGLTDGDVLTYSTDVGAWRNADAIDGGNW